MICPRIPKRAAAVDGERILPAAETEGRADPEFSEGFSLLEMMMVVTVILIVASIPAPYLHELSVGSRMKPFSAITSSNLSSLGHQPSASMLKADTWGLKACPARRGRKTRPSDRSNRRRGLHLLSAHRPGLPAHSKAAGSLLPPGDRSGHHVS
jgi:prepilin-type N-terminal cleavage/methylation domain-containing protein